MFKGYLKYPWIGLYLFVLIFPYTQFGRAGLSLSAVFIFFISFVLIFLYFQEKRQEKEYEEVPQKEECKEVSQKKVCDYTFGNYIFDLKKLIKMFNEAQTDREFLKVFYFLENMLGNVKNLSYFNTRDSGYKMAVQYDLYFLYGKMQRYKEDSFLKLSDLKRISLLERKLGEELIGITIFSETEYHNYMRKEIFGLKGFERSSKIRKLKAKRAYQKRLGR